jgi:hypothetical protein
MLVFAVIIWALTTPAVLIGVQSITPKEAYPAKSVVMTSVPTADYPNDLKYCYLGESTITVSVYFDGVNGNEGWMNPASTEFSKCNITLSYVSVASRQSVDTTYYDFEYETMLTTLRGSADILVCFTDHRPMPSETYGTLAGYSRINLHLSVVFMPSIRETSWSYYIALHELSHCLGFIPQSGNGFSNGHSTDPSSVMYSTFSGTNLYLLPEDIALLDSLH